MNLGQGADCSIKKKCIEGRDTEREREQASKAFELRTFAFPLGVFSAGSSSEMQILVKGVRKDKQNSKQREETVQLCSFASNSLLYSLFRG